MASKQKCMACGKFMSAPEGAKCHKCDGLYHRPCVKIPPDTPIPPTWLCPECKVLVPRGNADCTPIKGLGGDCEPLGTSRELAVELRLFRGELTSMREEMAGFRKEMAKYNSTILTLNERADRMDVRVEMMEKRLNEFTPVQDNRDLLDSIAQLKLELNERDQELLLNDVEITGLPEAKGENPVHMATMVANKLGVALDERDIVSAYRVGSLRPREGTGGKGNAGASAGGAGAGGTVRVRALVVRLARRALRDQLLRAARVRRECDTAGLDLPGQPTKFYVNERLTKMNRELFFKARMERRRLRWKYAWTRDGQVRVRQDDGKAAHRIRCEADLKKAFGN